eukprot:4011519-Alexandrium_andersonii.AAC.1
MDVRRRVAQESILRARGQGRALRPLGPLIVMLGADACVGADPCVRSLVCRSSADRGRAALCGHSWLRQQGEQ